MEGASRLGFVPATGYRLYYEIYEPRRAKGTVLVLHGGPGGTHEYLHPLRDLARRGYRVVLFDQLGCGRSDLPKDYGLFTLEHNVREVDDLRRNLRLGRVHVLGSSYGGLLAIAYTLAHPRMVRSLTTTGGLASVPLTQREMLRLKSKLPRSVRAVLRHYERRKEFEHPRYQAATAVFYRRHVLRTDPWPADVVYTFDHMSRPVYGTMNGPNEFTIVGTMRSIDLTWRLHEIRVPTLITGGRFDEVTPKVADSLERHIAGAERVTFEQSSHMPFWEERSRYIETVARFLDRVG
ncbi:MAG: proline iminopeptidase-family hydrolase [Thermoplasmata archaeon]|nr:proline iminopeptidase-family hydrolase [Thermoplasmata archaeon]